MGACPGCTTYNTHQQISRNSAHMIASNHKTPAHQAVDTGLPTVKLTLTPLIHFMEFLHTVKDLQQPSTSNATIATIVSDSTNPIKTTYHSTHLTKPQVQLSLSSSYHAPLALTHRNTNHNSQLTITTPSCTSPRNPTHIFYHAASYTSPESLQRPPPETPQTVQARLLSQFLCSTL